LEDEALAMTALGGIKKLQSGMFDQHRQADVPPSSFTYIVALSSVKRHTASLSRMDAQMISWTLFQALFCLRFDFKS
jgi:hypothetical protein